MHTVRASARYGRAIAATADLLAKLRIESMFVGNVARSAWLGSPVDSGSLDVLALMNPEQKNQVAMMASNRGFRIDRGEIEQREELDLVPMSFVDSEGDVRVHVLLASNALYGRMFASRAAAGSGETAIHVAGPEDLALLLSLSETTGAKHEREMLIRLAGFDRRAYNERLISIGLQQLTIAE